jgi:hypothetical protein
MKNYHTVFLLQKNRLELNKYLEIIKLLQNEIPN